MDTIFFIANNIIGNFVGVWINDAVIHIKSDDLSNFAVINYINFGILFVFIFLIQLLPLKKEVNQLHRELKE